MRASTRSSSAASKAIASAAATAKKQQVCGLACAGCTRKLSGPKLSYLQHLESPGVFARALQQVSKQEAKGRAKKEVAGEHSRASSTGHALHKQRPLQVRQRDD